MLAARGARETAGGGAAVIDDPEEVRQLKRQASRVYVEAVAIAVVVIAVVMLARGLLGPHMPASYYGPE
jgi:hypothetical protein